MVIKDHQTHGGHGLGFWLLVVNVRYKANVAGVVRVASNFSASGMAFVGLNHYAKAPALGLGPSIPMRQFDTPEEAVHWARDAGLTLVSAERTTRSVPIHETEWPAQRVCFVLGDEQSGVPESLLEASSQVIDIPMYGQSASMNIAVCAAVVSFEHIRRLGFPSRLDLNISGRASGWQSESG